MAVQNGRDIGLDITRWHGEAAWAEEKGPAPCATYTIALLQHIYFLCPDDPRYEAEVDGLEGDRKGMALHGN